MRRGSDVLGGREATDVCGSSDPGEEEDSGVGRGDGECGHGDRRSDLGDDKEEVLGVHSHHSGSPTGHSDRVRQDPGDEEGRSGGVWASSRPAVEQRRTFQWDGGSNRKSERTGVEGSSSE